MFKKQARALRDLAAAQTVTSHVIRTNIFLQKQTLRKMEGLRLFAIYKRSKI